MDLDASGQARLRLDARVALEIRCPDHLADVRLLTDRFGSAVTVNVLARERLPAAVGVGEHPYAGTDESGEHAKGEQGAGDQRLQQGQQHHTERRMIHEAPAEPVGRVQVVRTDACS